MVDAGTAVGGGICERTRLLCESLGDADRAVPMYSDRAGQPTAFNTPYLGSVLHYVALSTVSGLARRGAAALSQLLTLTPSGAPAEGTTAAAVIRSAFKTHTAFTSAVTEERERLINCNGSKETVLDVGSGNYPYIFRDDGRVQLDAFRAAPVRYLFTPAAVRVPAVLVGPSRGAAFELLERDARRMHGPRSFVLAFFLYSDGATLSNSCACMAHTLRLRLDCLDPDQPPVWLNISAIPQVFPGLGAGAATQAKTSRREVLQRALFVSLRDVFEFSRDGVEIDLDEGKDVDDADNLGVWRAYMRLVCYRADSQEQRSVACLRGVGSLYFCSLCLVRLQESCVEAAFEAVDFVDTVSVQLMARDLAASDVRGSTAEQERLCDGHSCNPLAPALACVAGLGTPPYFLYQTIGFDTFHVRYGGVVTEAF